MIARIKGQVLEKALPAQAGKQRLVIMTPGGVGYDVLVSAAMLAGCSIGQEIEIHTYLKVGQDAMDLYGFAGDLEREFFMLLLTVSGVGPKTAMSILSLGSIDKIQSAIGRGDLAYLTGVSGLGKKTAERLVVELKSKIVSGSGGASGQVSDVLVEVIEGLVGMGYDRGVAKDVVTSLEAGDKSTEALLREALRKIK